MHRVRPYASNQSPITKIPAPIKLLLQADKAATNQRQEEAQVINPNGPACDGTKANCACM